MNIIELAEQGRIPDPLIRWGVRRISRNRLRDEYRSNAQTRAEILDKRLRSWRESPIAVATSAANAQHYAIPVEFFHTTLGPLLKYSCCLWDTGTVTLEGAEVAMLELYAQRAKLADGQSVLDLGCGWGSFTLWAAARYPHASVLAVSNSGDQKRYIDARAAERGLSNVEVITADINDFEPMARFDRIVSIEMMEHVRNHALLFQRIRRWLLADGLLFSQVFCHRELAYPYEDQGDSDWMSRHFFSGGMMPSYDLFLLYQDDLRVQQRWWLSGKHYTSTSNAWLLRLDASREQLLALFARDLPAAEARTRLQRWRMFYLAVAEFFALDQGTQWGVGHYLFTRKP